jgi:hypothetical protein
MYTATKKEHYDRNETERLHLWQVRAYSKANPTLHCIIEGDGMDQMKTTVPHLKVTPKSLSKNQVVKNHVFGFLINGHDYHCFVHHDYWKGGANNALTLITEGLKYMPRPWPAELTVQLDNTAKENKNITVFAFLALLVHRGIFEKVITFFFIYRLYEEPD